MPIWSADYLFLPDGSIAQAVAKAKKERSMTPTPNAPKAAAPAVAEAEECKRLAQFMWHTDPGDCNISVPAEEAFEACVDRLAALAAAPQQVAAWMDSEGRVFSAAQMENARNHQGGPGRIVAAKYSIPLYAAPTSSAPPSQASATGEV